VIAGHGKTTIPQVALGSTALVARFLVGKVMAYSPRGSLYHKRICLLYSVVKEPSAKVCCFHVKAGAEQERGGTNHALRLLLVILRFLKECQSPKSF